MEAQIKEKIKSVFDARSLSDIYKEIQEVYAEDSRPWIIGFSGGKDSTTSLQLVWNALLQLPKEKRTKPVYVISSDTYVETPVIIDYINSNISKINTAAKQQDLPITATKLYPKITETFWVNLIGRGYPTPSISFRWCTDRLKIKTSDRFILSKASEHGEVILVLGVRKSESATRAQMMNLYKIAGSILSRHSKFAQSFVYTPIEDFTKDDVWTYLLQNPSPWGANNRDLAALYRSADGECPLVVDDVTPPCGNSRFGCWVCTVVAKDKSIQALIDNGEEWLEPLLDFRNKLAETQDPEKKQFFREHKRLNGKIKYKKDGNHELIRGPYKFEYCKDLLRNLLKIQKKIREEKPEMSINLIRPEELHEIRRIWKLNRGDWQDTLPKIYREIMGQDLDWIEEDKGSFSNIESQILEQICNRHHVPIRLVSKLLDMEHQVQGMGRRASIFARIEEVLGEEWRSEEEVLKG
ncbi:MAG: DNA phosphorothioation system sulfurtransferase DndC [Prolixibacteraceae bacterium]|jgi:DNA sulfur modification protein DndC|nr:DNA phosphorothioation system sulfurtransferase DndC [Prolixibacteraceae bacterium]